MIQITLPDGSVRDYNKGSSSMDVALSISEGLARNVLAAKVDGFVQDANLPIHENVQLQLLTWSDLEGKSTMWHSSAHIMAEALEFYYPGIKLAIGPPITNGFYYDIDLMDYSIKEEDLARIEEKMKALAKERNPLFAKKYQKLKRLLILRKTRSLQIRTAVGIRRWDNYFLYSREFYRFMSWSTYS